MSTPKIKLTVGEILNDNFKSGFMKLARLPLPNFKDSYAMSRCQRLFAETEKTYEQARANAVIKNGERVWTVPKENQAAFDAEVTAKSQEPGPARDAIVEELTRRHGTQTENYRVLPSRMQEYVRELMALRSEPVELYILERVKIPFTLIEEFASGDKNKAFSSDELVQLDKVIEVVDSEAQNANSRKEA